MRYRTVHYTKRQKAWSYGCFTAFIASTLAGCAFAVAGSDIGCIVCMGACTAALVGLFRD